MCVFSGKTCRGRDKSRLAEVSAHGVATIALSPLTAASLCCSAQCKLCASTTNPSNCGDFSGRPRATVVSGRFCRTKAAHRSPLRCSNASSPTSAPRNWLKCSRRRWQQPPGVRMVGTPHRRRTPVADAGIRPSGLRNRREPRTHRHLPARRIHALGGYFDRCKDCLPFLRVLPFLSNK